MGKLLGQLSIKIKMLLLVTSLSALVGFFAFSLINEWNEDKQFSTKERYGTDFYAPTFRLMKNLQLHRGNSYQVVKGNENARIAMQNAGKEATKAFDELQAIRSKYRESIELEAGTINDMKTHWDNISQSILNLDPDRGFQLHSDLIEKLVNFVKIYSADSNLTLDPEIQSSYLIEMLSFELPTALELSAALRGAASGLADDQQISEEDENRLVISHALMQDKMWSAIGSVEKVSKETEGSLDDDVAVLKIAMANFSEQIKKMIEEGKSDKPPAAVFALGTAVVSAGFSLGEESVPQLQKLLDKRIQTLNDQNQRSTIMLGVSFTIVLIFAFLVVKQLLSGLSRANGICAEIQKGNFDTQVVSEGTDEMATLIAAISNMQSSLRENRDREVASAEAIRLAGEETQRIAAESKRIADALEVCDTSVMIADNDFNITYLNKASKAMFEHREKELAVHISGFSTRKLLGDNVDRFHKHPSHQRALIDKLTDVFSTTIKIGGVSFHLIATPLFDGEGKRSGTVVEWEDITDKLAKEHEEQRVAAENLRVRIALDNSSTNTMIADASNTIIYTNKSLNTTMNEAESDLRKSLPSFSASRLLGTNMDEFHANPAHQKSLIGGLTRTYDAQIKAGSRTFRLIVNPVLGADGERLGTVVEWTDRTQEVKIEEEIRMIVDAASNGDFSQNLMLDGKKGFFLSLAQGLNQLVSTTNDGLLDIARVISALAGGDLTQRIDANYQGLFKQLKDDCNQTVAKLEEVLTRINEASNSVTTGSSEIASGNLDLSQRTEEQASSLEETTASMEQMTGMVQQTSQNAERAHVMSGGAVEQAEVGGQIVRKAVEAMGDINKASKKIADIIGVIDEIAFQTNLLALNAAVEAARAGEQGRGFAVVAGEVRNLAQRSASAAKEIKDLIRDSVTKVDVGTDLVNRSGTTLNEIVNAIKNVSSMIGDINKAAQDQSSSIVQINQAVSQMDEMTQQNAALVEEATAAGETMASQARALTELISFFQFKESTGHKHARPAQRIEHHSPTRKKASGGSASIDNDEWEEF